MVLCCIFDVVSVHEASNVAPVDEPFNVMSNDEAFNVDIVLTMLCCILNVVSVKAAFNVDVASLKLTLMQIQHQSMKPLMWIMY